MSEMSDKCFPDFRAPEHGKFEAMGQECGVADIFQGSVIDRAVANSPPPLDDVGGGAYEMLDEKDPHHPKYEDMGQECGVADIDKAGTKSDGGKHQVSMVIEYFGRALMALASVSEYGARKYIRGGWRTVDNAIERYTDAHDRHRFLEAIEGPYDDGDSGLAHAAQVAWNALARLEKMLEAGVIEDRTGNEIGPNGKQVLGTSKKRGS